MKSSLKFLLLISFATALLSFSGCDNSDSAPVVDEKEQTRSSEGSSTATKNSKADPVGEWKLDVEATIKANSALLKNSQIDAGAVKETIRGMIWDFLIEPDNTFQCYQKAGGVEADFSGVWELKEDRIKILQKFKDDQEEEDKLTGTLDGDRMDLIHNQAGGSMKLVLVR